MQCRTQGGGQKGHMRPPPPPRPQSIPCPQKKVKLSIDLVTPKASYKKVLPVRFAHSNLIPTRSQSVKVVGH